MAIAYSTHVSPTTQPQGRENKVEKIKWSYFIFFSQNINKKINVIYINCWKKESLRHGMRTYYSGSPSASSMSASRKLVKA